MKVADIDQTDRADRRPTRPLDITIRFNNDEDDPPEPIIVQVFVDQGLKNFKLTTISIINSKICSYSKINEDNGAPSRNTAVEVVPPNQNTPAGSGLSNNNNPSQGNGKILFKGF